jgi:hypothetical protein
VTSTGLRIGYRRGGGFTGIELTAEVTADELAVGEAELAARLLADPSVGAPTRPADAFPSAADQFSYQLEVTDGSRKHTFQWAEFQVPDAVRPLLAALNQHAKPA